MNLLVVGSGGREHALCWALRRDAPGATLYCVPGNAGTATLTAPPPVAPPDLSDVAGFAAFASRLNVDLTIVGPELPLARGLADVLRGAGHRVFGPLASAARIEASKAFAKDVMRAANVPTAASATFTEAAAALAWVDRHPQPLVVKASGLAAGKGAIVCATRAEAAAAVRAMLERGAFGDAGREIVIEEFLDGEELSVLAVTNGREVRLLPAAQDHKRLREGDQGPNTGGMGAYAPVTLATPALLARVEREILAPTLAELERRGAPFRGVLYAGLMIGPDGAPRVVEFNCRLGDPEAQAVLPLVRRGLLDLFWHAAEGAALPPVEIAPAAAVATVLAAAGYPEAPRLGAAITIPPPPPDGLPDEVLVFHAGTGRDALGRLIVTGGRVLAVTGVAPTFPAARAASLAAAERITFEGKQFRRDIGWRELRRAAGPWHHA